MKETQVIGSKGMRGARLLYLDNLRTTIIILVILVHLSVTYGGEGSWYYEEGEPDLLTGLVLTVHNLLNQSFFMGCLFLISGYLTPASYDRKGPRRFLLDRMVRLGIPMLAYDLVIHPFMIYWLNRSGVLRLDSFRDWAARYYTSFHVGRGPLWFVEALLLFSLFYTLVRLVFRTTLVRNERATLPGVPSLVLLALFLGVASFLVRLLWPIGWSFGPLNLQFPFFPQYIVMFIVGIVAYRRQWLTGLPRSAGRSALLVAAGFVLVLFPLLAFLGGLSKENLPLFVGGFHWQALALALWEQALGVALIVGLLVLFRERLNRHSRLSAAASANSYATYVVHAPVLIVFTLMIRGIPLYPLLKFAVAALIAVPLCFLSAALVRQLPAARRIL
jgi:glucan biosynthesis protein C